MGSPAIVQIESVIFSGSAESAPAAPAAAALAFPLALLAVEGMAKVHRGETDRRTAVVVYGWASPAPSTTSWTQLSNTRFVLDAGGYSTRVPLHSP